MHAIAGKTSLLEWFSEMADSKEIQQIVEHAVAQVLDRQLPKLQAELVARITADLPTASPAPTKGVACTVAANALVSQPSPAFMPEPRKKKFCGPCSMPATSTDRALRCSS